MQLGTKANNLCVACVACRVLPACRFEWYSGFSLLLTLVWMYTEVLRLLQMFAGGRDD